MRWLAIAGTLAAVALTGCAGGEQRDSSSGGDQGSSSSGGAAAGGAPSNCATDCSAIHTEACFAAICDEELGQCVVVATEGQACDDEVFCTVGETCNAAGLCTNGLPNQCGVTPEQCQTVICDERDKGCQTQPKVDGQDCDPGDLCVIGASCVNGLCVGGTTNDCFFAPVPNECYVATCDPATGQCEAQIGNEGEECTDVNELCTVEKTCSAGSCVGGKPKDCSWFSAGCFDGQCDAASGQCFADPVLQGEACSSGTDLCNVGTCSSSGVCVPGPINEAGACTDGWNCTTGETCTSGTCGGGTSANTIYFMDDFADNSAGWTLDTSWAIGPTAASTGYNWGGSDPVQDHSPSYDNGVAGVVLGGNITPVMHGFYWLTSPVIDTSGASSLVLEFYRWLNGGFGTFMSEEIQVYNGSIWITVFDNNASANGIADTSWQHIVIDILAHANSNMQVRFGYDDNIAFFVLGGWNVDDVLIANAPCN